MSINQSTIKKSYGLSAGRCNICKRVLIEENVQIGQMAHVIAKSSSGPRGEGNLENDNRYENLILLCSIDHTIVDCKPNEYPVSRLHQIKNNHEAYVYNRLNNNRGYLEDLSALNTLFKYIPILELREVAMELPNRVSIRFEAKDMFDNFLKGNPHLYPFQDRQLDIKWTTFISNIEKLDCWITGSISGLNLITISDMFNSVSTPQPCYNIYVSDDRGNMVLNKRFLSPDQIDYVSNEVSNIVQEFIYSHTDLVHYVRDQFSEIEW
ncbi:TPA: hypothetical protein SLO74_003997 [Citrobacter freundii]|uniref:hypothetical protein n=1 Tax=Citrobacter freundii TaxID=546 RepID=UPI0011430422|nr:hypothetical protein [Citrobacter freundii]MBJ9132160.1 hypothetical protein [Citrobacter freundii]HEJ0144687.1 hypothetical protein [Citrobacter freundii]